jgi:hypothetical protein
MDHHGNVGGKEGLHDRLGRIEQTPRGIESNHQRIKSLLLRQNYGALHNLL